MLKRILPIDKEKLNSKIIRTTCLCWLPAKLLGWRMFTTYRAFPIAPVVCAFNNIPAGTHTLIFLSSVLLMIVLFILPKNKPVTIALLIVETISCLLDQNRLQPWNYLYAFILFIFLLNPGNRKLAIAVIIFIFASTYFYSGLGKLNEGFLQTIWSKMVLHFFLGISTKTVQQGWLFYSGFCVGFFELMAGAGLLFLKTRKLSAALLIVMHLFILLFLGPLGLNYNRIIWPWNIAMIAYLYLIFFKNDPDVVPFTTLFTGWNKLVFICWGILPAFNLPGYWDNYLSSGMYSGKLPQMLICVKDTSKCPDLKRFCKPDYRHLCNGSSTIDLQYWALSETSVAPYPEIRVYKTLALKLQSQYPAAGFSFVYLVKGQKQQVNN